MALVWQVYLSIVTLRSSHRYAQWLVSAEVVWWIDSKIQWWSLGEAPQGVSSLVCFGWSRQKEGFNQQNNWIYITNWPQRPNVMRLKSFAICMLRKFDRSCALETISILLHFAGLKVSETFREVQTQEATHGSQQELDNRIWPIMKSEKTFCVWCKQHQTTTCCLVFCYLNRTWLYHINSYYTSHSSSLHVDTT